MPGSDPADRNLMTLIPSSKKHLRWFLLCSLMAAPGFLYGHFAGAGCEDPSRQFCTASISSIFKNSKVRSAEEILREHAPYDRRKFTLTLLTESDHSAALKAVAETGETFVLKVNSLQEAFNDYYSLKLLRKMNPAPTPPIRILESVFLAPKAPKSPGLDTKVIQKNPWIEGRPLAEILVDVNVRQNRKRKLYKHFSDWLKGVENGLRAQGFEVTLERPTDNFFPKHKQLMVEHPDFLKSQPALLKANKPWTSEFPDSGSSESVQPAFERLLRGQFRNLIELKDEEILILLKSDNIMVTENDELILFDPF
jgi:hypothetical protein